MLRLPGKTGYFIGGAIHTVLGVIQLKNENLRFEIPGGL
jgi:hypothetical protein